MRLDETISAPSSRKASTSDTPKPCRSPDAIRKAGPPRRSLPKWKSKPVTAWLIPRLRSSMSVTNCSALWPGEFAGKGLLDDGVEAELGDQPRLHRRRRDQEQRHVRAEDGARMRLEGQHQGRHAAAPGLLASALEHGLMAAMDAVEIADRHHAAAQLGRQAAHRPASVGRAAPSWRSYFSRGMTATGRRPCASRKAASACGSGLSMSPYSLAWMPPET